MIEAAMLVAGVAILALGAGLLFALVKIGRKLDGQRRMADHTHNALIQAQAMLTSLALPASYTGGDRRDDVICSMTTLEGRLGLVHFAIESMLLQSHRPRSIELYLSDKLVSRELPHTLTRLQPMGLNVHFVRDVGPHTKLIYALQAFGGMSIVTLDDDIVYPHHTLATLFGTADRCPGAVVGNWARRLRFDRSGRVLGIRDGTLLTPPDLGIEQGRDRGEPDLRTFVYGTGAVLYPPGALDARVHDVGAFQRLCPTEDDIWFKAMALLKGTPAVHTGLGMDPRHQTIRGTQAVALRHTNHDLRKNEAQMRAVFDALDLYRLFPNRRA